MRLAPPFLSPPSASALAAFFAALRAPFAPFAPAPPAPARAARYALPLRVQVALQAAARARRA